MSDTTLSMLPADLVAALGGKVSGRVVTVGDTDWETARHGWDLQVDQRPGAIVHVRGVDESPP